MTLAIFILAIVFVALLLSNVPISICIGMATVITMLLSMPAIQELHLLMKRMLLLYSLMDLTTYISAMST